MSSADNNALSCSVQGKIKELPAKTTLSFLLSKSGSGVNDAMSVFGSALQTLHNFTARQPDVVVEKLGYWTVNGANYMCADPAHASTLIKLSQSLHASKVPIANLQIDPWWNKQDVPAGSAPGCADVVDFKASPVLFPGGAKALVKSVGVPLLLYTAFWSTKTPALFPNTKFVNSSTFPKLPGWYASHTRVNPAPPVGVLSCLVEWSCLRGRQTSAIARAVERGW